ncbi:hypothetical protein [Streptomyces sp. NPDC058486]|uniref:hypothetical protein n=1 Tax=unclassified Streptomyces TaxID=2593676 RepID=UPI003651650D
MVASRPSAPSIDATTAALQEELPRLEQHQQDLEQELAAVSQRVLSVRTALTALLALADTPAPLAVQPAPEPVATEGEIPAEAPEEVTAQDAPPVPAPRKAAAPRATRGRKSAPKPTAKSPSPSPSPATSAVKEPGGVGSVAEQVVAVLAQSPGSPMRARDVAEALGRDISVGSVNAVRSTLDRLVATSRADRAGRGLYQATTN